MTKNTNIAIKKYMNKRIYINWYHILGFFLFQNVRGCGEWSDESRIAFTSIVAYPFTRNSFQACITRKPAYLYLTTGRSLLRWVTYMYHKMTFCALTFFTSVVGWWEDLERKWGICHYRGKEVTLRVS